MPIINQGDCQFMLTDLGPMRQHRPTVACKCGQLATRILEQRRPIPCLEPAARAVLSGNFEALVEEWESEFRVVKRPRTLNRPTASAPLRVHQAWADAGGVSLEEYRKNPLLGRQPAGPEPFDPFAKAREIIGQVAITTETAGQAVQVESERPSAEDLVGASGASK